MTSCDENGNVLDSGETARRWEAANPKRAMELNDVMDAMTLPQRREFYQALTKEEQNGIIPEYMRRRNNERARPGSLVKPKYEFISIRQRLPNGDRLASHGGLALVVGVPEHGTHIRYLFLLPHWQDKEGHCIFFAEGSVDDLEEVKT